MQSYLTSIILITYSLLSVVGILPPMTPALGAVFILISIINAFE